MLGGLVLRFFSTQVMPDVPGWRFFSTQIVFGRMYDLSSPYLRGVAETTKG